VDDYGRPAYAKGYGVACDYGWRRLRHMHSHAQRLARTLALQMWRPRLIAVWGASVLASLRSRSNR